MKAPLSISLKFNRGKYAQIRLPKLLRKYVFAVGMYFLKTHLRLIRRVWHHLF